MTPEYRSKLRNLIIMHEKFRDTVYTDTTGHLTIGYGHCLQERPISQFAGGVILDEDIMYFSTKLSYLLDFFNDLSDARKSVLIDMAYNLGLNGLMEFIGMIEALKNKDYDKAADEMLNSKWAEQTGDRAKEDAYIMRTDHL